MQSDIQSYDTTLADLTRGGVGEEEREKKKKKKKRKRGGKKKARMDDS